MLAGNAANCHMSPVSTPPSRSPPSKKLRPSRLRSHRASETTTRLGAGGANPFLNSTAAPRGILPQGIIQIALRRPSILPALRRVVLKYIRGRLGRHRRAMRYEETIKGIREQLKAIKEVITVIEFRLSQLESENQMLDRKSTRLNSSH